MMLFLLETQWVVSKHGSGLNPKIKFNFYKQWELTQLLLPPLLPIKTNYTPFHLTTNTAFGT